MSKVHLLPAAALLALCACAQQPTATGPLPFPTTQTASADWAGPLHPDGTLAQADDEADPSSLEERARAVFGNTPLQGTLPDNELNQELLFKFLLSDDSLGQVGALLQVILERERHRERNRTQHQTQDGDLSGQP